MKKIALSLICFVGLSCALSANDAIPIINTVFYGLDVLTRPRTTVYVNGTYVDPYSYYYAPTPVYFQPVPPPPPSRYYPFHPTPPPPRPIPPRHDPGRGSHPGGRPPSSEPHSGHHR